jgi:hypothetical protein
MSEKWAEAAAPYVHPRLAPVEAKAAGGKKDGSIPMWDNRCTLHARTDFSAGERRLLRRVTILGEKPV